ncbi:hypothetical protein [uncultured Williamsia sp.]|uniref:hypothetical protein n=1 Tax=uncultured Williamsia sp. TaxID=259311 RepID=UPI0026214851|nr:hypothetical protein [uncultured Williamsia sp.]
MTELWLLEDLEPFPHPPVAGDVFSPTTFWLDASSEVCESPVPTEICTRVTARVEPRLHGDHTEWVAEFDGGFQTMLRGDHRPGIVELHGCLFWDRYSQLDFLTEPRGSVHLLSRSCLVQRRRLMPTRYPHWFTPHYSGPLRLVNAAAVPDDHDVRLRALRVQTDLATPPDL